MQSVAGEREHQCDRVCLVRWYYMSDKDRFHVYARADIEAEKWPTNRADLPKNYKTKPARQRRIDWQETNGVSTLEFHNYKPKKGETAILIGETQTYCMRCIMEKIRTHLHEYNVFGFNCRTVTFIIFVGVLDFDEAWVYEQFKRNKTLCGLGDRSECVTSTEIEHYIEWRRTRGESVCKMQ